MKKKQVTRESKLTIKKLTLLELNNLRSVVGGNNPNDKLKDTVLTPNI